MKHNYLIFYADDDPDDRLFFSESCFELELHTQTFDSGYQLLDALKNEPYPSVIYLDLNMPAKNGFEVLEEIRMKVETANIPVVILSTSQSGSCMEKTYRLGANLYLVKPSKMEVLKDFILKISELDWNTFNRTKSNFVYIAKDDVL